MKLETLAHQEHLKIAGRKRNEDGGAPRCITTKPEGLIIV